jgi:5-methyltetrahydrofolate--homocysteine methyltransferase
MRKTGQLRKKIFVDLDETRDSLLLRQVNTAVLQRDFKGIEKVINKMVKEKMEVFRIMNQGLVPGILAASDKFRKGEFAIPELLMASHAVKIGLNIIRPLMREKKDQYAGRVAIGTVKFDIHDIGKNLVAFVLEGNGFEVFDLGMDVSPEKFLRAVEKYNPQVLAMSALLTVTMNWMKPTIQLLRSQKHQDLKILVGGAPVTQMFAQSIGADGYCHEAVSTPTVVRKLLGIPPLPTDHEV